MTTRCGAASLLHGVVFFSGIAGLGYQVIWVRMLSTGLGHEVFAVLAIVAAFFGGLALGALVLDRRVAQTTRPALWYAGLEAVIGLWAVALVWVIPSVNDGLALLIGPMPSEIWRWSTSFGAAFLLLLPATAAMGATLPAAERVFASIAGSTRGIGGLYAANATGAMAGALLTIFVIAPQIGFSGTLWVLAALNAICAIWALAQPAIPQPDAGGFRSGTTEPRESGLLIVLFATGLLGIGYEVAAVRALAQILENTVYSFAAALAVYLLGTALGAAIWQAFGPRSSRNLPYLIAGVSVSSLGGVGGVYLVGGSVGAVEPVLGTAMAEIVGAGLVLFLPSLAFGMLFAELAQRARRADGGLGAAFAANALGAALAPVAVGVVLIPAIGVIPTLASLSAGYLALGFWASAHPERAPAIVFACLAGGAIAVVALAPGLSQAPAGGRLVQSIDGVSAHVSVTEDAGGEKWLVVNDSHVMGGTGSYRLDRIQGHAILMQHPEPRQALFLGVGTGATFAAAAAHPDLAATGVELLPEVLETLPEFAEAHAEITGTGALDLHIGDARRWVRADPTLYDVIIADTYHPAKDGAAMLYTVEHFAAIKARLADGGIFAQWLPLHQLDLPTLKLIVRSFQAVFPQARLQLGNLNLRTPLLVLVSGRDGDQPRLRDVMGDRVRGLLRDALDRIGLGTPFALYGGFLAGPDALRTFAEDG
ncbi:MAG: fused MFS/spermidine synthase, partial [Pseudomonadota bacterium]